MLEKKSFTNPSFGDLPYWLYTPEKPTPQMPLLTFLHGAGECGTDLDPVLRNGIPRMVQAGRDLPCYAIFPQCPLAYRWSDIVIPVKALIDHVAEELDSDKKALSLTGLSMGGFGTWSMAVAYPDYFSAIAPICGGGLSWAARVNLTQLPIWAFHGDADSVVPVQYSLLMVDEINKFGGHAQLTLLHGVDHNSWDFAYEKTNLIAWLTAQRKQ